MTETGYRHSIAVRLDSSSLYVATIFEAFTASAVELLHCTSAFMGNQRSVRFNRIKLQQDSVHRRTHAVRKLALDAHGLSLPGTLN